MKTSNQGVVALMVHEGIVPAPYRDSVGVWTYGIGHTKAAGHPNPAKMVRGMPDNLDSELVRVFEVFRNDLARYEAEVVSAFTADLTQAQFDAAVSFHYNTGAIRKASWVKKFNKGDFPGACIAIMNWCKPKEITERRKAEQNLFRNGVYPTGRITVWNADKTGNVIWKPAKTLRPFEAIAMLTGGTPTEQPKAGETVLAKLIKAILGVLKSWKS